MLTARPRGIVWIATALLCLWVLGTGVSPDFTPVRSEIANAHGFSRGVLNLVVIDADASFGHAPWWSLGLCAAGFLLLGLTGRSGPAAGIASSFLSRGAVGAGTAVLAGAALSPYLTPYRVVLASRSFVLCVLLVCGGRVLSLAWSRRWRWTPLMTGAVAAAFFASALLQTLSSNDGNYSGFLHLSRDVAVSAPFLRERPALARSLIVYDAGYDGQFMYLMAFDPLIERFAARPEAYRAFIDNPPYRYGRIGFSALTHVVAGGDAATYPAVMVWLIVAAHFALGTLLALFAVRHGRSPMAGLWYLAVPAFMSSLMSALPEALAAALLVAGFLAWQSRRPGLAAAAFAAALLVRETGVVLVLALALAGGGRDWKRSALMLAGALAPVALWRLFVASRFFEDFGWAAILANPGDLGLPFAGLLQLSRAGLGGTQPGAEAMGALIFPLILTAALVLAALRLRTRREGLAIAAMVYAAVAVSLNYGKIWSHLPSGERGTFELFLCLLLMLLQARREPARVRYTLTGFFAVLGVYTFLIAPDSVVSRAATLLIR